MHGAGSNGGTGMGGQAAGSSRGKVALATARQIGLHHWLGEGYATPDGVRDASGVCPPRLPCVQAFATVVEPIPAGLPHTAPPTPPKSAGASQFGGKGANKGGGGGSKNPKKPKAVALTRGEVRRERSEGFCGVSVLPLCIVCVLSLPPSLCHLTNIHFSLFLSLSLSLHSLPPPFPLPPPSSLRRMRCLSERSRSAPSSRR